MGLGLRLRTCLDYKGYLQACQKRASLASGSTVLTPGSSTQEALPTIRGRSGNPQKPHQKIPTGAMLGPSFKVGNGC
jgi:hypothetical protein